MAIAFDANLGSISPTGPATSVALTTIAAAAAGSHIFVAVYTWDGTDYPYGVTDTDGNVYVKIGDGARLGDADTVLTIYGAYAPSGLTSGDAITVTFSGSTAVYGVCALSATGLPAKSPLAFLDGFAVAGSIGGATFNSGNITTTVANALILRFVCAEENAGPITWDAGTEVHDITNADGAMSTAYQIVSSTGTHASSGTFTSSSPGSHNQIVLALADTAFAAPYNCGVGVKAEGTGGVTPALPLGWAADDIWLLVSETANEAVTAPSGWVAVADSPQGSGTAAAAAATRLSIFWRRAVGGDAAPSVADPGDHIVAQILGFRGCITTGDPWDVTSGGVETPADTTLSATGDTTTVADCLVVVACSRETDVLSDKFHTWVNADLTSLVEIVDIGTTQSGGGGFGVATGRKAAAGAYAATTATLTTSSVKAFMTIALKPPVGAAAGSLYPGAISDRRTPRRRSMQRM